MHPDASSASSIGPSAAPNRLPRCRLGQSSMGDVKGILPLLAITLIANVNV